MFYIMPLSAISRESPIPASIQTDLLKPVRSNDPMKARELPSQNMVTTAFEDLTVPGKLGNAVWFPSSSLISSMTSDSLVGSQSSCRAYTLLEKSANPNACSLFYSGEVV
jgi:hypothetical protein